MKALCIQLLIETDGACPIDIVCEDNTWAYRAEAEAVKAILASARQLVNVYESGHSPLLDPVDANALGRQLADTFLAPLYAEATGPMAQPGGALLFTSPEAELLNLPWELLPGPTNTFITADARWSIRRTTRDPLPDSTQPPVARPLRILFTACAPTDLTNLDFEKEEEAMLNVVGRLGDRVHLDIAEAGTFDELRDLITEYKPHVVHLSGHGVLSDGIGHFAFENERGEADLRDAHEMAAQLFAGRGVRLVFVSGCQTAQAGAAGVCQRLTADGHIPAAMGWGASIGDRHAIEFAGNFYHELAVGCSLDDAVSQARVALLHRCKKQDGGVDLLDARFALPQIYAGEGLHQLVDESLERKPPSRPGVQRQLLGDYIQGLREGFVGRRRILQKTRPVLCSGEKHLILLTGIGGAGKSTLATRLANRFQEDGYQVAAIQAREAEPTPFGLRVLTEIADACQRLDLDRDERMLRDGERPMADRLRLAVKVLNEAKILLVLDNLESILVPPPAAPTWLDLEFANFFNELQRRLTGTGRAILTCRYAPEGFNANALNLFHEPLPDFTEASFLKYLCRHKAVAARIERGELSSDLLSLFHQNLGSTPRFIEQSCAILAEIDPEALREQLEAVDNPAPDLDDDRLLELRQAYFRDLFLPQLYDSLSPEHRNALSRLSVTAVPLPLDGVSLVAGFGEGRATDAVAAWLSRALIQRFGESGEMTLYAIYPLQRAFLLCRKRLEEEVQRRAHKEMSRFLRKSYETNHRFDPTMSAESLWAHCLYHADSGEDIDCCRWAATRLANKLLRLAEYQPALDLIEPLLLRDRSPDLLKVTADILEAMGEWKRARQYYEEALATFHALHDRAAESSTLHQLASLDCREGDYGKARRLFEQVMELRVELGDVAGEAATWHQIASIDIAEGDYVSARTKLEKSISLKQTSSNFDTIAVSLDNIAIIDTFEGDYSNARKRLLECLELRCDAADRAGFAGGLHNLACLDFREGEYGAAREKFKESLRLKQLIEDRAGEQATIINLASIDIVELKFEDARNRLESALDLAQSMCYREAEATAWHELGTLDVAVGETQQAIDKFETALVIRQETGDVSGEAAARHQLGTIEVEVGNWATALDHLERSLRLSQKLGNPVAESATLSQIVLIAWRIDEKNVAAYLSFISVALVSHISKKDAAHSKENLYAILSVLGNDVTSIDEITKQATFHYKNDRCAALIRKLQDRISS